MTKQLTSNTSYFIVCEARCFGPYMTIIRSSCESSQKIKKCWLHVGIPTMFTISTSILYLADKYIKFYPLNFIYLSARYNILLLIVNIVGIPTCSQHLLTWFVRRPDDDHIRTETVASHTIKYDVFDVSCFIILILNYNVLHTLYCVFSYHTKIWKHIIRIRFKSHFNYILITLIIVIIIKTNLAQKNILV